MNTLIEMYNDTSNYINLLKLNTAITLCENQG